MLSLSEFIQKWLGEPAEEFDSKNLNQCVDIVLKWAKNVSPDITRFGVQSAYAIADNFNHPEWRWVKNMGTLYPIAGSIVVFDKTYGKDGHVAVANGEHRTEGKKTDWVRLFSQNDPAGSPCALINYRYTHILGWFEPLKDVTFITMDYKKELETKERELKEVIAERNRLNGIIEEKDRQIKKEEELNRGYLIDIKDYQDNYIKKTRVEEIKKELQATIESEKTNVRALEGRIAEMTINHQSELAKEVEECKAGAYLYHEPKNALVKWLIDKILIIYTQYGK